jgi:hypothetical protein
VQDEEAWIPIVVHAVLDESDVRRRLRALVENEAV